MIERLRVRIPVGAAGEISSPELDFFALFWGVRFTPVLPQWHVKCPGHRAKSAGGRLHLNSHTPLTQQSRSWLTMPLSRHSVGTYPQTSSNATCKGIFGRSRLGSLSHQLSSPTVASQRLKGCTDEAARRRRVACQTPTLVIRRQAPSSEFLNRGRLEVGRVQRSGQATSRPTIDPSLTRAAIPSTASLL